MEKIVEKYWKITLIVTIIILFFIPINIIISKDAILQVSNEYVNKAQLDEVSQINELADMYVKTGIESRLFSVVNILILLVYPVILSTKFIKKIKEEKLTKEDFVIQIACISVPYIINAIILFIIKFTCGISSYLGSTEILKWMGISILVGIFLTEISNLIGYYAQKQSTHILSIYAFLFMPVLIIFSIQRLLQIIVLGYVGFSDITTNIIAEWPGLKVLSLFSYNYTENMYLSNFGIIHIIAYILLIALLIYSIYKVINKQKKYNILSTITLYGILFFITVIFIGAISQMTNIAIATLIALIVSGIIYILCVVFKKEKNIKKLVLGYSIYSLLIFTFVMIVQNNIFGFETKIPDVDDVEYAVFTVSNPLKVDPQIIYKERQNIQYIIDRQKQLVEEQSTIRNEKDVYYRYYIQYVLKNGEKLTRAYDITKRYEDIYYSDEFLEQRYSYILDEELNEKLTKLSVIGIYDNKVFDITVSKDEQLFTGIMDAISKDIKDSKAYILEENAYGKYGNNEGLMHITVDISINEVESEDYLTYAKIDANCELVKLIQKMIDEENGIIVWEK